MNKLHADDLAEFVEQFLHEQVGEAIEEYFYNGCLAMTEEESEELFKIAYHNMIVNINVTIKE